jgi:hypothetical protein
VTSREGKESSADRSAARSGSPSTEADSSGPPSGVSDAQSDSLDAGLGGASTKSDQE